MEHNGTPRSWPEQELEAWSGFDATGHSAEDAYHADRDTSATASSTDGKDSLMDSSIGGSVSSERVVKVETVRTRLRDLHRRQGVTRRERTRAAMGTMVSWLIEGTFIGYALLNLQSQHNISESLHTGALALSSAFFLSVTAEMGLMPFLHPSPEQPDGGGEAPTASGHSIRTSLERHQMLPLTLFSLSVLGVLSVRLRVFMNMKTGIYDIGNLGVLIVSLTAVVGTALLTGLLMDWARTKHRQARDLQNQIWDEQLQHDLLLTEMDDEEWAALQQLSTQSGIAREAASIGNGWNLPWFKNRNAHTRSARQRERAFRRKIQADLTALKRRHDAETKAYRAALTECVDDVRTEPYVSQAIWSTAWQLAERELERREGHIGGEAVI